MALARSVSTQEIQIYDSDSVGEEFLSLAEDGNSFSAKLSKQWEVEKPQFVNWRWQMSHQLRSLKDVQSKLQLNAEEIAGLEKSSKLFNMGITPYYTGLMDRSLPGHEQIRLQGLPHILENVNALGLKDPLCEVAQSPVKEVVHIYPDRVAFCVAMLCPVYCRYCYRKRRDDEDGLHFNRTIIDNGIAYIASNSKIRDVLITGGDPFIASNQTIENLLIRLRQIPHVEIIRFGTRTPVTLPYRVTEKLAKILAKYHPVWLNTHFNCVEELTSEAALAIKNLVDAGIPVGNQTVLLKGVNDTPEKMKALLWGLVKIRVRPYYIFHPHRIEGTDHLRPSVDVGMEIMKSLRGKISGYAIPTYVMDTPSGKIPLSPNHILGRDGDDLILKDLHGEIWREPQAYLGS